jgi:hypothetical protein
MHGGETVTPSLYEWFRVVYTLGNPPRSRDFPEKGRMRSLTLPLHHLHHFRTINVQAQRLYPSLIE